MCKIDLGRKPQWDKFMMTWGKKNFPQMFVCETRSALPALTNSIILPSSGFEMTTSALISIGQTIFTCLNEIVERFVISISNLKYKLSVAAHRSDSILDWIGQVSLYNFRCFSQFSRKQLQQFWLQLLHLLIDSILFKLENIWSVNIFTSRYIYLKKTNNKIKISINWETLFVFAESETVWRPRSRAPRLLECSWND